MRGAWLAAAVAAAGLAVVTTGAVPLWPAPAAEVVATGVLRPLQLAIDGRSLIVLSPGPRGDTAGEIHRVDLDADLPVDLSRQPTLRIPFADGRAATLGSLVLHPQTRELFLGEENGTAVYRLGERETLAVYATGLRRLGGGTTLAFDGRGRLVLVDNADPLISPGEERPPPGLEQFRDEDYRGPLVFRLTMDPAIPLPRRLGRVAPLFPRAWGGRAGGALLPRLISVAAAGADTLVVLTSGGQLFRLGPDGVLTPFTRLPAGQYSRISMVMAADGSLFVSGGFHVGRVFQVSPAGAVGVVASDLADPEGIALDAAGAVYVAESARHRIVRLRPL
jgi:hypothetical protein